MYYQLFIDYLYERLKNIDVFYMFTSILVGGINELNFNKFIWIF